LLSKRRVALFGVAEPPRVMPLFSWAAASMLDGLIVDL